VATSLIDSDRNEAIEVPDGWVTVTVRASSVTLWLSTTDQTVKCRVVSSRSMSSVRGMESDAGNRAIWAYELKGTQPNGRGRVVWNVACIELPDGEVRYVFLIYESPTEEPEKYWGLIATKER
jgi:hypothetical protein